MPTEETTFKDLNEVELDKLKDLYVDSRLNTMSIEDLKNFVQISIEDQIKGTVGPQEEKEAWLEMKDYFKDCFEEMILKVKKVGIENPLSLEQEELEKRKSLLEKRKKENDSRIEDMW